MDNGICVGIDVLFFLNLVYWWFYWGGYFFYFFRVFDYVINGG